MEGQPKKYVKGTRWHKTFKGEVKPCTARIRACPYGEHYDTFEGARENEQNKSLRVPKSRIVEFSESIGGGTPEQVEGIRSKGNFRESADEARKNFLETGQRPIGSIGSIKVDFPNNKKITLRRETYDVGSSDMGVRYNIRYFLNEIDYYDYKIPMNTPGNYEMLEFKLQEYVSDTVSNLENSIVQEEKIAARYEEMMQTISEIEVMSRGAKNAKKELGIDLFSTPDPKTLLLETSYSRGSLQTYDITESLELHSAKDTEPKDVLISIKENLDNKGDSYWTLKRNELGEWYVGANTSRAVIAQKVKDSDDAVRIIDGITKFYNVPEEKRDKQSQFVHEMINELDPAIESYKKTMKYKQLMAEKQKSNEKPLTNSNQNTNKKKKSLTERLGSLFG